MSRPRSRIAATVATVVTTFLLVSPAVANADTTSPGSYHAKADATALALSVFGQGVTFGITHAENASDPKAAAAGIGALIPSLDNQQAKAASADANTASDDKPEECGPISLPPDVPVVDLVTACSSATALVANGFPGSVGNATVAAIHIDANDLLGNSLNDINSAITEQLLPSLKDVFAAVDQSGITAEDLISELIDAITGGDLIRITLGPSHSTSGADAATETATAAAQGAVIEVLPREALELAPVLTIEVGAASNTISIDRNTGQATVAYLPSIVTATFAPDIATALNLATNPISVAPGQSQCLGLPAPLDSCITVAGGTQSTDDQGVTHANASGVSLHLLTGVEDGIRLDLAATSVEGVGALEASREAPPPDLARTGGTTDTLLGGALFAVAVGGMVVVRRSRFSTPTHSPSARS
ncbi:MAG: hypothetical protein QOD92_3048 [Acidimicrobiaceae bacterium]|jgi:hypothetical protein